MKRNTVEVGNNLINRDRRGPGNDVSYVLLNCWFNGVPEGNYPEKRSFNRDSISTFW